ncbi:MAG: peptidoglycan DD-metalloendopeptidase family protein [Rhodospirillaceae bacterium]|jgi:murein DD-endopeptidase MepM/ murein hydrolase activator NlpD|nr:peptidoglycan DD-metalloendopeptidase family protein [Rhodospirillaceae bacterium]MBT5082660.1 peptidoglycan DD-metalloendopeptidase family protein [Rhodospirillaceae bacterium]MBT5524176.1 peptidoglycan DD-metalloendopeptidase family protein [Rhodospirillaceae bacterium]MBT7976154.1 peptidoglycan DD-metalloendopeptidase family protein [Rhodospirillaceae bacterium]
MSEGKAVAAKRLLDRVFPERQILLRSRGEVSFVTLGQGSQIGLCLVGFSLLGWLAYASTGVYFQSDIIAGKDAHIARMVSAHDRLNADMRAVESRYQQITANLESNQKVLGNVLQQRSDLGRVRAELLRELKQARKQRDVAISRSEKLNSRLAQLENSLRQTLSDSTHLQTNLSHVMDRLATSENVRSKAQQERSALSANLNVMREDLSGLKDARKNLQVDLESSEEMVARLTDQRDHAFSTNLKLNKQIGNLEGRLKQLQVAQSALVGNIQDRTNANITELETVIEITGLNVNSLLGRVDHQEIGTGGPLISSSNSTEEKALLQLKTGDGSLGLLENRLVHWTALNAVLERLPIAPPVDNFSISSSFGKRQDPFTKRRAFHSGMDLAGAKRTSIYATSPGVVTFAGWKGPYGRLVEIDHGLGLRTRYGHLRKTLVKKGQKIDFRHKIGLMGSSGRSTGTHVHYEVVFDGKPLNPRKFLKAGKYVFKG